MPRSPQGEDHEAGIKALIPFVHWQGGMRGKHNCDFAVCQIEPCPQLRTILSRCPSPERNLEDEYHDEHQAEGREVDDRCGVCRPELAVNPSPERNTEKLVEALREIARYEHATAAGQDLVQYMVKTAHDALAEFSSTTKEQP
jgi:hypothetical protein